MERALIVGCGDIGIAVGVTLAEGGWRAWGLRRTPDKLPGILGEIIADIRTPLPLRALPDAIDTVFFLPTPDGRDRASYSDVYVTGLRNIIDASSIGGPLRPRLIFVSSTSVYGQNAGEQVDEESVTEPREFNGKVLLEAEEVALHCPFETLIARFGGIYGPGRLRLIDAVRGGAACQADPPRFTNRIHRDDCVRVLVHLAQRATPPGVLLAVDDAPAPECEVWDFIADELGAPRPPRAQVAGSGQGKRCQNRKLKASGYHFHFPTYREGYRALISSLHI